MFAHQMWVDTAANPSVLKIRNADNDAWITIGTINQTGDTFTLTSAVSATTLNTSGAVVFNDAGADVDFRVESDTDANAFFVEGSSGNVGIGTSLPAANAKLDVNGAGRISAIGIKSFQFIAGAATYTKTLTITGLDDGAAIINIGLAVSGSSTSLAAAYLFGGISSATNNQKTVAVLNATTLGFCSITGITKVSGGFSVDITLTGGVASVLRVNVMGTGAQNAAATFA
jgi:hypothetical protein